MKRQLKIFLTGLFVVVPFAITVWIIYAVAMWLDNLGKMALEPIWNHFKITSPALEDLYGVGAVLLIVTIFLVGLLMHFWLFRGVVALAERAFERLPGVKTVYESVRDLMKLFSSDSRQMGRVVEYRPTGSDVGVLGILTNEHPEGAGDEKMVAVYFPLSYMIGGPVLFVPADRLRDVDMPVEKAMRICAMAHITSGQSPRQDAPSSQRTHGQEPVSKNPQA